MLPIVQDAQGVVLQDTCDVHFFSAPDSRGMNTRVQFQYHMTADGAHVIPPSRTLLEIHAANARIAHLSGAAEVLKTSMGSRALLKDCLLAIRT